ncbi:unnamed protein product [Durusdinium trenchii]|uniref:Uncharacterized protein n=1 Tax=Durusdinium trenchii TaxID=1381693 RepID=A0ABP0JFZ4_9DINO
MPLLLVPTPRVLSVLKHVACIADGTLFGSYSGGVAMWPLEARVPYDRCHLASLLLAARLSLKSVEARGVAGRVELPAAWRPPSTCAGTASHQWASSGQAAVYAGVME